MLYDEGRHKPERGLEHNWHVWCLSGATEVLLKREYVKWLDENPDDAYTINFGNASYADINPGHQLWRVMAEVAMTHRMEVFQLGFDGIYVPWAGKAGDLGLFDAIKITKKQ